MTAQGPAGPVRRSGAWGQVGRTRSGAEGGPSGNEEQAGRGGSPRTLHPHHRHAAPRRVTPPHVTPCTPQSPHHTQAWIRRLVGSRTGDCARLALRGAGLIETQAIPGAHSGGSAPIRCDTGWCRPPRNAGRSKAASNLRGHQPAFPPRWSPPPLGPCARHAGWRRGLPSISAHRPAVRFGAGAWPRTARSSDRHFTCWSCRGAVPPPVSSRGHLARGAPGG